MVPEGRHFLVRADTEGHKWHAQAEEVSALTVFYRQVHVPSRARRGTVGIGLGASVDYITQHDRTCTHILEAAPPPRDGLRPTSCACRGGPEVAEAATNELDPPRAVGHSDVARCQRLVVTGVIG